MIDFMDVKLPVNQQKENTQFYVPHLLSKQLIAIINNTHQF